MNEFKQRIIELEEKYFAEFCQREEDGGIIRYSDAKIPDMHTHNFTWLRQPLKPEELKSLIGEEIRRRQAGGHDFLQLRMDWAVSPQDLTGIEYETLSPMAYYRITAAAVRGMKEREDLEVIRFSDLLMDEARELDEICEEADSLDFTKRRFERRAQVYLEEFGPDNYLALLDWDAVGACDYFASEGTCMLEDFVVDPELRGQGIGTSLLKTLAQKALEDGNDLIFMSADASGTVRAMYQKLGFEKIWETTEVLIKW